MEIRQPAETRTDEVTVVDQIHRFAVIAPEGTPKHIAPVKIYTYASAADEFAKLTNGTVVPALDVDALTAY